MMNLTLRIAILKSVRTQTRLASATGIPEPRLSRIVNGWQQATPGEQAAISQALGIDANTLFQSSAEMNTLQAGAA